MNALSGFSSARVADLKAAQVLLLDGWRNRSLPASHELTMGRIFTPLALLVVLNFLLTLTTSNGRYVQLHTLLLNICCIQCFGCLIENQQRAHTFADILAGHVTY